MDRRKKEAIEESAEKWKAILESRAPLVASGGMCALCEYAQKLERRNCDRCPLKEVGKGCLPEGSLWGSIARRCWDDDDFVKDHPEIEPLVKEMYETIIGLLEE